MRLKTWICGNEKGDKKLTKKKKRQKNRLLPREQKNIYIFHRQKHKGEKKKKKTKRTLAWRCNDSQIRHSSSTRQWAETAWVSSSHLILNRAALMSPQDSEKAEAPEGKEDKRRQTASYLTSLERTAAGIRHYNSRGLHMRKKEGYAQKKESDVES